jgi:hypothetical protein
MHFEEAGDAEEVEGCAEEAADSAEAAVAPAPV